MSAFCGSSGKIIAYSGTADPCVPYPDAIKYYNRVCKNLGGYERVGSFFKYFLLPGKDHGNGGKGVNAIFADENRNGLLVALRRWCEEGKEPECIFAAHLDFNSENQNGSRLKKIYPYRGDRSETSDFPLSCDVKYLEKQ